MPKLKPKYTKDLLFVHQIKNIFKSKSVLVSTFVLLGIVIFYNFMSKITMPFLELPAQGATEGSSLLEMLNLLGGGGLTNMSLFAIGISPYITTQIIVQLLSSDVIPPLAKLSKSGEKGRKKIEMISRIFTLPFAILQAYGIISLFAQQGVMFLEPGTTEAVSTIPDFYVFFYVMIMTAGTYVAIFLSDLITKKGIGNGVTTIILVGIVSSIIPNFTMVFNNIQNSVTGELYQIISFIVYILFYCAILWIITFVNSSTRKLPIQQTGQSLMKLGDDLPYLPFKLNTGGVIPVIFASSIMTLPLTIGEIVRGSGGDAGFADTMNSIFSFTTPIGLSIYVILIILFTFFYSYVQLNPQRISQDFMKSGRFILGVKIGVTTEKYITRTLYRINWIGGPFLALVAAMPYLCSMLTNNIIPSSSSLGGTGIIIMVTGSLDLWQALSSASIASSYTIKRRRIEMAQNTNETDLEQGVGLW
ncbi:MAG: preprotein translocase subunit SecY [Mycoplasma sp.]